MLISEVKSGLYEESGNLSSTEQKWLKQKIMNLKPNSGIYIPDAVHWKDKVLTNLKQNNKNKNSNQKES